MKIFPSPLYLFIFSLLSSITVYIFYIIYRLNRFDPQVDLSPFISHYAYQFNPEIEVQLYILGWLVVIPVGICIFFILQQLLKQLHPVLYYHAILSDLLSIVAVYSAMAVLIHQIALSMNSTDNALVRFFQAHSYVYFTGFSWWQFLLVLFFSAALLFLWFKKSAPPPKYTVDALAIVGIVYFVSIIVNWRNGWNNGAAPYFDYQAVVGPINDVLGGKTLLVNIHSQYGLLMIYVLSLIFKVIPLSYNNFFWVNYSSTIVGYILLYGSIRMWLKSVSLSVFGIFLISQHHYFSQNINILFYGQSTFLRFGWWILLLVFLIVKEKVKLSPSLKRRRISNRQKYIFNGIELLLLGVSVFWGFDVGVYTLAAYLAYRGVNDWLSTPTIRKKINCIAVSWIQISITLALFFAGLSVFTRFRAGLWPDWRYFTGTAVQFTNGWTMMPMPAMGPYLLFLGLYAGCFAYILFVLFFTSDNQKQRRDLSIVSFVTVYGILQFLYYVGRSVENNLHAVILPFILLILWTMQRLRLSVIRHRILLHTLRWRVLGIGIAAVLLLSFSTLTAASIIHTYHAYERRGVITSQTDELPLSDDIKRSIDTINQRLSNAKYREIALISGQDTFFLMKTKSVNTIESNNIYYFYRYAQFDELGNQLLQRNPQIVFMDHHIDDFWSLHVVLLKNYLVQQYHLKENIGYLDIWERN